MTYGSDANDEVASTEIWRREARATDGDIEHMPEYRCSLFAADGALEAELDIHCADDDAAIARARALFHDHRFEVWQQARRVLSPRPGDAPRQRGSARLTRRGRPAA